MVHLQDPLGQHAAVHLGEVFIRFAGLGGGGGQEHLGHALQVLDAGSGGLDGVGVADGFGVLTGVGAGRAGGGETEPRGLILLARPGVERGLLGLGGGGAGDGSVAPVGRPDVIGPHARDQVLGGDSVFGLGDVIEPRVVHDGGRGAHFVNPVLVVHLFRGIHGAGLHVVLHAEGVADFMGQHVLEQAAHEVVG